MTYLTDDPIALAAEFRPRRALRKNRWERLQQRQKVSSKPGEPLVTDPAKEQRRQAYARRKAEETRDG